MHILFISSHPNNTNGYSSILYNLTNNITNHRISIYGCQMSSDNIRKFSNEITVFDVSKNETYNNINENGFNYIDVGKYIEILRPDNIVIYNDSYVCYRFIEKIIEYDNLCGFTHLFKITLYLDLVYPYIKQKYINVFNRYVDTIIVCNEHWKHFLSTNNIFTKLFVLKHGFQRLINKKNINNGTFKILNLNRNTLRKRLDITMRAYINVLKYFEFNISIQLYIKESTEYDAWNLVDIFTNECPNINIDDYVSFIKSDLSDKDVHLLYNTCDLGVNTCEGEGFGLCNYEHACYSKPQIMPDFPQFYDLYPDNSITYIKPKYDYYIENRDDIGGIAAIVDYKDISKAVIEYISNKSLYELHSHNLTNISPVNFKNMAKDFISHLV